MTDDQGYAGDVLPRDAWAALNEQPNAVMIDVRTAGEHEYVGRPDLSSLNKPIPLVEWCRFPGNVTNATFAEDVIALVPNTATPLYFLCRSGVRSMHAAKALTARGYDACFNVLHGFEGDKDDNGHRGTINGWKVDGLPWSQG